MARSFAPIAGAEARVLVLGTLPSVRSLELGQYYGHPRNAFWPLMLELFAGGSKLDYDARTALLVRSRVALWDVLQSADRPGSLDSSIVAESVVPNDIAGFLASHPQVCAVFFNGTTAAALFRRHIAAKLSFDSHISFQHLPSTSPANATHSLEAKRKAWQAVFEAAC